MFLRIKLLVIVFISNSNYSYFHMTIRQKRMDRQVTNLHITGEFSNFTLSHSGNHLLPHRKLELLPQYELHRFTVTSHCPGVVQHSAITKAGAVMKLDLLREKNKRILICYKAFHLNRLISWIMTFCLIIYFYILRPTSSGVYILFFTTISHICKLLFFLYILSKGWLLFHVRLALQV